MSVRWHLDFDLILGVALPIYNMYDHKNMKPILVRTRGEPIESSISIHFVPSNHILVSRHLAQNPKLLYVDLKMKLQFFFHKNRIVRRVYNNCVFHRNDQQFSTHYSKI